MTRLYGDAVLPWIYACLADGLSQREAAEIIGVSESRVSHALHCARDPKR